MAKYHYIVTSKRRLKEDDEMDGTKKIIIEKVTNIEENGNEKYHFQTIAKGEEEKFFNIVMIIVDTLLTVLFLEMIIVKDIYNITGVLPWLSSSNWTAIAGALLALCSSEKVRGITEKLIFKFGEKGNKLLLFFVICFIAMLIAFVFSQIGITNKIANIICLVVMFFSVMIME